MLVNRLRRIFRHAHRGLVWTLVVFTIIGLLFFVLAFFLDRESTWSRPKWSYVADALPQNVFGVALLGRRPDVDMAAGTVSITWRAYACGNLAVDPSNPSCQWGFSRVVDFYLDSPETPSFSVDPSRVGRFPNNLNSFYELVTFWGGLFLASYLVMLSSQNTWQFKTTHAIRAGTWDGHLSLDYHFPFDSFDVDILFRATDNATGLPIPFITATIVETRTEFALLREELTPLVIQLNSTSPPLPAINLHFIIGRARSVMAFSMIIMLINWGLTVIVMHITIYYITENYRRGTRTSVQDAPAEVPREILLLPVSVILTVPSLRLAMPSVPGFGIMLDIIGYFPNLIIISISSMILVLLLIYQRKDSIDSAPQLTPAHEFSSDSRQFGRDKEEGLISPAA